MKNFIQAGNSITTTAIADIKSGDIIQINSLLGIAAVDALAGETLTFATTGVYLVDKAPTEAIEFGAALFYNVANKHVTSNEEAGSMLGHAVSSAAAGSTQIEVRLAV